MSPLFTRRRIVRTLLLFILIAAGVFGYTKREYIEQIPIGCAFKVASSPVRLPISRPDSPRTSLPRRSPNR